MIVFGVLNKNDNLFENPELKFCMFAWGQAILFMFIKGSGTAQCIQKNWKSVFHKLGKLALVWDYKGSECAIVPKHPTLYVHTIQFFVTNAKE